MLSIVLVIVFGGLMAFLANRKGYNPIAWFLAAGVLGLVVLGILPDLNKGSFTSEEIAKKARAGNLTGGIISVLAVGLSIAFFMLNR